MEDNRVTGQGPDGSVTETTTPCSHLGIGPGGCASLTAETDGITSTNPNDADTDNDGLTIHMKH